MSFNVTFVQSTEVERKGRKWLQRLLTDIKLEMVIRILASYLSLFTWSLFHLVSTHACCSLLFNFVCVYFIDNWSPWPLQATSCVYNSILKRAAGTVRMD